MLTATFSCFDGLSESAELRLWQSGILSWNHFPANENKWLSLHKTQRINNQIPEARAALDAGLADWFLNRFEGAAKVRVYPHFKQAVRFLDIETTGLDRKADITSVAVYDGKTLSVFVKGRNLSLFPGILKDSGLLVTFNGNRFDLPFLRRRFKLDIAIPHLDLLPVVKAHGYHGGQKKCELKMGVARQIEDGLDGRAAVALWEDYERNNNVDALRRLVAYNCQDAVNLETILINVYNREMQNYPLFKKIPVPLVPDVRQPFQTLFDK